MLYIKEFSPSSIYLLNKHHYGNVNIKFKKNFPLTPSLVLLNLGWGSRGRILLPKKHGNGWRHFQLSQLVICNWHLVSRSQRFCSPFLCPQNKKGFLSSVHKKELASPEWLAESDSSAKVDVSIVHCSVLCQSLLMCICFLHSYSGHLLLYFT